MQRIITPEVRIRRALKLLILYVILIAIAMTMVGPFLWMVSTAIKPGAEAYVYPPRIMPNELSIENIQEVMSIIPIFRYLLNTGYLSIVGTLLQLIVASMAAYAFARLEFPGRDAIFFMFLGTMMIPGAVTMIPTFILMRLFGWMDSYNALIIPGLGSAFGTFLLRQFFLTIPNELEDAARIDGAGRMRFYLTILLPLSVPALITLGIFSFLGRWNSFMWPLLVIRTKDKFPIQLGLAMFRSEWTQSTHLMMTATTISVIPLLIVFIVAQKHFVQGVVLSGFKG
ncbi:MAG: carbohydrate ABC transporter permease [Anaerolineae bacterium]|jgi:multiple sugar transport system permease protein